MSTEGIEIVLKAPDESRPQDVDVVTEYGDTRYGTREMTVRDPDGRLWTLQVSGGNRA